MSVHVSSLTKSYGAIDALKEVSLEAASGELLVVVGPSGSGKSTLLRCIAGLERPDAGNVAVDGTDVTDSPPGKRDLAMVFQDYALYPHLDAQTNIAFPLLARKTPRAEVDERVRKAADMLDLGAALRRRPAELSGGERRRVALARAVVRQPAAFLMDEPLASLDVALKRKVQIEIRDLQAATGTTTLYVTHDQVEAMMLGHRLAVMRSGRIEQAGAPQEIYDRPANTFVASFLGRSPMNLMRGSEFGSDAHTVGIRPEDLRAVSGGRISGTITSIDELGAETLLEVRAGERDLLVQVGRLGGLRSGDEVSLDADEVHVHLFDADGLAIR